jgi:hypothetical protein
MSESKASGLEGKFNPFRSALRTIEFRGGAHGHLCQLQVGPGAGHHDVSLRAGQRDDQAEAMGATSHMGWSVDVRVVHQLAWLLPEGAPRCAHQAARPLKLICARPAGRAVHRGSRGLRAGASVPQAIALARQGEQHRSSRPIRKPHNSSYHPRHILHHKLLPRTFATYRSACLM